MTPTIRILLSPCLLACFVIVSTLVVTAPAHGVVLTFDLDKEFSQGTEPVGVAPWIRAEFEDTGPGEVTLTMSDLNLTGNQEHVKNWDFAFYDAEEFLPFLVFSDAGGVIPNGGTGGDLVSGAFAVPTLDIGDDLFQADGDGFFDIMFTFDATDGPNTKFGSGDAVSYVITQSGGAFVLDAHFFDFPAITGGGQGIFVSAAQIGGITSQDESGWIGLVPEPSSAVLLILGVIALLPIARRRIKR